MHNSFTWIMYDKHKTCLKGINNLQNKTLPKYESRILAIN